MTPWIRTGRRVVFVLCALLASSGIAHAQALTQTQNANFGAVSIGQVEIPLIATGGTGGPYTWSIVAGLGELPPGLALRTDMPGGFPSGASAGLIGVATTAATYNFTLRVTRGAETADQASTLTVTQLRTSENQYLPDAFVGRLYIYGMTASGGAGTVTWTPTEPAFPVPPGLTLSPGGVLSGTPTTAGEFRTGYSLDDGTDIVYQGTSLRISAVEITTPGVLPNATQNASYSATIAAVGGTGSFTFSSNGMPNGLTLNTAGGISGTANTSAGKASINVTASDGTLSYTKTMSLNIVGVPPLLPNISPYGGALNECTLGVPCSRPVSVSSGGTAPFEWLAGGLPDGMSIRAGDGVTGNGITPGDVELWGTPSATGTSSVELTVTDADGATATNTFQLKVSPLLQTSFLDNATLGVAYSEALRVIGGSTPYTAAQTGGTLAAGLALDGGTLTLAGTPTESGYYSPVFTYTDSAAQTLSYTNSFNVNGAGPGGITIFTSHDLGSTTTGQSYSTQLNACCAGSIVWSQTGGTLPGGVSLAPGGGLSGTPASPGQYTFVVRAEDGANAANYAVRQFTLNVTTISINGNSTLPTVNAGTAYTNTFTATGGSAPLTWTVAPFSTLPPGLSLGSSTGTLSGTPTATGQFFFSVNVADTASQTASRQFSLSIYPAGTTPPVFQSQSSNFGTFSIGQLETALSATGGNGTYAWSIVAGSLPPGLAVRTDTPSYFQSSASAGLIGVATTPGDYAFTVRVTSASAIADQASTLRVIGLVSKDNQLPDAFVGVPYSYALSALGNTGSVIWAASVNQPLPAWLTLSADGVLSGTPPASGFPNISFSLTDDTGTVFKGVSLTVNVVRITTPGVLPNVMPGGSYNTTIAAAGGTGGITFNANGLPNGLNINSSGVISGTVNSNSSLGKVSVNVTATAGGGGSYTKTMSIDVIGAAPTLPSIAPSGSFIYDCTVGVSCTRTIQVQNGGSAPFTWGVPVGLPPGMFLRSGSGITSSFVTPGDAQLWGVPTAIGSYNVQVTVTDSLGATATNTFPMNVSPLMQTTFLQNGTIDTSYSQTLRVLGGTGPYTAVHTGGQLTAGLSVNTLLVLSGFPAESGNFNPAFTYTDSASHTLQLDSSLFISGAGGSGFSINTSSNLGSRTTGSSYSQSLSASGSGPITWSLLVGGLPPGVTLSSGGSLNGTLTTSGTYTFLLKATGTPSTHYAARQFTLGVTPLSISTSSPLPFGNVASAYSQSLTATGATGSVTWTIPSGNYLPPGLSLAANGVLSGTPTWSGQYQFTITASDTGGNVRLTTFKVSIYPVGVAPPVSISTNGTFGTFSIGQLETPLTATGGTGTYTWSLLSGTLPPGLAVRTDKPSSFQSSASAGLIGVATTPGFYSFTLRATSGAAFADLVSTLKVTAFTRKDVGFPDAFVGTPYTYGMTPLDNAGAVTWVIASGPPAPPGLSLSSAGVFSGTPTTPGFYNFNVNGNDTVDTIFRSVSINVYAVRITTAGLLPGATQDAAYNTTIAATGGSGGHTFEAQCCLPDGLTLSAAGTISGTMDTGPGLYGFTVTAKDSNNASYSKVMSINVIGVPPVAPLIAPYGTSIDDCTIGLPCTLGIAIQSGGAAPFAWGATGLPPGMSIRTGSGATSSWITPGDGELWGYPTAMGTYSVTVTLTAGGGATATSIFPLRVVPLYKTTFLPNGTIAVPYSQVLRVLGGSGTYTAAQIGGQLPSGVTLNTSTLLVSGTPAENGNFNTNITYSDTGSNTLTISSGLFISGGTSTININTNANLGSASTGTPYSYNLSACCAGSIVWSVTSGTVPPGLTLSSAGLLGGTPSTIGTYTFLLRASDGGNAANYAARQFTLTVGTPAITLSATTVAPGAVVTATIANGPGNLTDWVGLFATGGPSANPLEWKYLNGSHTAPTTGQSGAALTFTMPVTAGTYELRFFRNNTYTVLVTSATITAGPPSIALSATTVAPGAVVTATIANGPGNLTDWVGLFATGAPPTSAVDWKYLNGSRTAPTTGLSGATLTFTLPVTAGTYELRFFRNNTNTVLMTSATITVSPPSIALSATTVAPGAAVTATIANGPGNLTDWVGLFATGAPPTSSLEWKYLNGSHTAPATGLSGATLTFTLPVTAGTYQLRFFRNNTNTVLVTSATITVGPPSIALSATTVAPGAVVTATIANGPGNLTDWVGLFATGAQSTSALEWKYLNGTRTAPTSGLSGAALTFTLPVTAGTYELRFFRNNTYTVLATSATISFGTPSIALSATTVAPGGAVTATIAFGPGNRNDWVALFATGAPVTASLEWKYLNGSHTAPTTGVSGAALTFTLPVTPGTYLLRFFLNNGYTVLVTSATITVQ